MKIKKYRILLVFSILFICMAFIFKASSTPYQTQDIKPLLERHINLTPESLPKIDFYYNGNFVTTRQPYEFLEFFIRKSGHVIEYMVLTWILLLLLKKTNIHPMATILLSIMCSFLVACTDEWLQTFGVGRSGHFIDVYTFDLFGMVLAIGIYLIIQTIRNKRVL